MVWAVSGFLVLGGGLLLFIVVAELALDSATFGLKLIIFGVGLCAGPWERKCLLSWLFSF